MALLPGDDGRATAASMALLPSNGGKAIAEGRARGRKCGEREGDGERGWLTKNTERRGVLWLAEYRGEPNTEVVELQIQRYFPNYTYPLSFI